MSVTIILNLGTCTDYIWRYTHVSKMQHPTYLRILWQHVMDGNSNAMTCLSRWHHILFNLFATSGPLKLLLQLNSSSKEWSERKVAVRGTAVPRKKIAFLWTRRAPFIAHPSLSWHFCTRLCVTSLRQLSIYSGRCVRFRCQNAGGPCQW